MNESRLNGIGDMRLQSGRKIAEIETIRIASVDSEYVLIPTTFGWQVHYYSPTGNRRCIAVDCHDEEHARWICKQDHIKRLEREIQRLKGEL